MNKIFTTLTILALAIGKLSAQNLLLNGSFESGLADWTSSGNVAVISEGQTSEDGSHSAVFNTGNTTPNGILSQSFATAIGTEYSLSFYYSLFNMPGHTQTVDVLVTGSSTLVNVDATSPAGTTPNTFGLFTYTFTANSTTTTVKFTDNPANNTLDQDGILDNVSVVAVPEPASISLLGASLLCAAVARRHIFTRQKS